MKKKLLSVLLVVCMLFGIATTAFAAPVVFTDVDASEWYADEVAWAYEQGLMSGTGLTTFSPDAATTRAMLVSILWRLEGSPAIFAPNPFEDVAAGKYYTEAVIWAYYNDIIAGLTATKFGPDNDLTREQLATILYNYAQFKGYDVTVAGTANILSYYDASDVATYAYEAMIWANANGLVLGNGGYLDPKAPAKRAQFASILYRYVDNVVEAEKEEPTPAPAPPVYGHNCTVREWIANGNGTHTGSCYCGATYTADCYFGDYVAAETEHTRTCMVCGYVEHNAHEFDEEYKCVCGAKVEIDAGETPVAIIGTTGYATVAAALGAAEEGDTIQLLAGNFETISFTKATADNLTIVGGEDVTVGTVRLVQTTNYGAPNGLTLQGITFNVEGITGSDENSDETNAINDLAVIECTFTDGAVIHLNGDCAVDGLTVKDCVFVKTDSTANPPEKTAILVQGSTKDVEITGNTISNCEFNAIQLGVIDDEVLISGNTINGTADRVLRFTTIEATAKLTISNNIITSDGDEAGELAKATSLANGSTVVLSGNTWNGKTDAEVADKLINLTYTAMVGDKGYTSVHAAIAAADPGDTVTLLKNVTVSEQVRITKAITFNGGGNTITAADDFRLNLWTVDRDRLMEVQAGATIQNVVLDSKSKAYGLQAFGTTDTVTFTGVTVLNSKGTGITINGAVVAASGLNVEGSVWAKSVNIDVSGASGAASLTLSGTNTFSDPIAICSDSYNTYDGVTKSVTVTAPGYFAVSGFTGDDVNMRVWTKDVSACEAKIGDVYYLTFVRALAVAENGATVELLDGNYTMPDGSDYINLQGKTLTITGSKNAVIDASNVDANDQFVTGATLKFEGVTLNFGHELYMGFANTASLTYKNCDITGLQLLFGETVTFEGCTIDSSENPAGKEPHSVWTYGAKNVNFIDCDFIYGNRAVNCYSDNDVVGGKQNVNFTDCTFTTTDDDSEGAVEINSCFFSVGIEVHLDDCTAPENGELAYISQWDSTNGAKTIIMINGEYVVTSAAQLQNALNNATGNATIKLMADITVAEKMTITQKAGVNIVLDGANHKFTGLLEVFGNGKSDSRTETLTIKNINFVAKAGAGSCIVSPDREVYNLYSYSHNVTVDHCTFTDPDGVVNCAAIRHEDGGDENWTVTNCVVDNTMHSIFQVQNVEDDGLKVSYCTVSSKNGANLNSTTKLQMDHCNFDVKGYAIRFGVNSGGNLGAEKNYVVSDSTLKSACDDGDAVIIFRASAVDAKLTLTNTTLTGTTEFKGNTSATTIIIDGVEQ